MDGGTEDSVALVDVRLLLKSVSRSWASTALPPTAPFMRSESMVVRNGATVLGIRGLVGPLVLLETFGGPRRMKSIKSELSSLESTVAPRA